MAAQAPLKPNDELRKRYWLQALSWLIAIYATLYWVRPACEFLKNCLPFSAVVNVVFVGIAIFLLWGFLQKKRQPSTYLLLAVICACYAFSINTLTLPEERIHLLQYGVLAILFFRALCTHNNLLLSWGMAYGLTFLAGWGDEVIQGFLPNRYYETKDVVLNGWSGFLGLLLFYTLKVRSY